jgi:hypothetical protein
MKKFAFILWILVESAAPKLMALDAPISTAGRVASTGTTVVLPITVSNFTNIGSCDLELHYNPAIATITSVTANSLLTVGFYGFDYNKSVPGVLTIGWYIVPGATIPDNSATFSIHFLKVSNGISPVTWSTDDFACSYSDGNFNPLNDSPQASFYIPGSVRFQGDAPCTIAPNQKAIEGMSIAVPVKVTSFNTIGAVSLTLNYNPAVLSYLSSGNTSGYPGLSINLVTPGTIIIGGYSSSATGETYPDSTVLFTMNFLYLGGTTSLTWYDDGGSCEYQGPLGDPTLLDTPQSNYYKNGSVAETPGHILNLSLFLESLYVIGEGHMRKAKNKLADEFGSDTADVINVELHYALAYSSPPAYVSSGAKLSTTGAVQVGVPLIYSGMYYITITHRNSILTVTADPVSFSGDVITYALDTPSKAFGDNLKLLPDGYSVIYAGDVDHNGIVDGSDLNLIGNKNNSFIMGYLDEDVNGDGLVDGSDLNMVGNNNDTFISAPTP